MRFFIKHSHWLYLSFVLAGTLFVLSMYGANMLRWANNPDFGWRTMYGSGPNYPAEVFEAGEKAGLMVGDTIIAINGHPYRTFDELFLSDIRHKELGLENRYTVDRDGVRLTITIPNKKVGFKEVLRRSGPVVAMGLVYIFIGVLVFLMKPKAKECWIFFGMTCVIGLVVSFGAPTDLMHPLWLYGVRVFVEAIIPAPIIHLALWFPKRRAFFLKKPWLISIPYLFSLVLVLLQWMTATAFWNIPGVLNKINLAFLLFSILFFIGSMFWNVIKDSAFTVRLQSQVILLGTLLGFFIPTADLLSRSYWKFNFLPEPSLSFPVFLVMFPASIGYTIAKHDLFSIDVLVRRTYGYLLSTGAVIIAYGGTVSILNVTFRSSEVARSPVFSLLFALVVVFLFGPMHKRFQGFVDKVFYRQQYDYRKTLREITQAMASMFDAEQIQNTLIGSAVKEMFLENGMLLLPKDDGKKYEVKIVEGMDFQNLQIKELVEPDVVLHLLKEKCHPIFRHDVELNPVYEENREFLKNTFQSFSSDLMMPVMYKDEMRGIISLGRKKSGKMFTLEDLDLLSTMVNQGAIALENANLVGQIKHDLTVRNNLARYLSPQIVDSVIKENVDLNLGGNRKVVTVLFSDIRDFTTLSETMPPDQLVTILNEYFTAMAKIIFANQGSLDKYIGDALVAVFGSLIPLENSAVPAAQAAIQMMQRMPILNEQWEKDFHFRMDIGIGLNTGEVFLGNIGSPERMEFTVIGDAVNVASRFSGLAKPGQILATRETTDIIQETCRCNELPPSAVKGKTGMLEVFELPYEAVVIR